MRVHYNSFLTWEADLIAKFPDVAIRKTGAGNYQAVAGDDDVLVGNFNYTLLNGGWIES